VRKPLKRNKKPKTGSENSSPKALQNWGWGKAGPWMGRGRGGKCLKGSRRLNLKGYFRLDGHVEGRKQGGEKSELSIPL